MGFFSNVFRFARRRSTAELTLAPKRNTLYRRCRFEEMEERRLMAADLHIGVVYYDPASGEDNVPNTFQVQFDGGASGTQLTHLQINTDKALDGLSNGDPFFNTTAGSPGVYGFHPFQVVSSDGVQVTNVNVVNGGTTLDMSFSGFTAGKTLVFTIDVDELGLTPPASAVVEGAEFAGSHLTATFQAPHYEDFTGTNTFVDAFDPKFAGSGLTLPKDNYDPPNPTPSSVLTAGALASGTQIALPSSLSGFVFNDLNLDNKQESGEPGIGNVLLSLQSWNGTQYVNTGLTTTTDSNGAYHFNNLQPGQYRVVETQPSGYFSVGAAAGTVSGVTDGTVTTPDIISSVVLLGGDNSIQNDFAEALPSKISGFVYYDPNNNGIKDSGEPGIPNTTVDLYNAQLQKVATTTTDSTGYYQFSNLMPGNYTVEEEQPAGYLDGKDSVGSVGGVLAPPDGISNVVLLSGTNGVNYNFGELLPASISGMVHVDMNGDCIYEPGEPLLAGVTIQLWNSSNQVIGTTTTDQNGQYKFSNLSPFATYTVHEVQPAGYFEFGDTVGSVGGTLQGLDTIAGATLGSGVNATDYDFCVQAPASISGMIHVDTNGDCIYEPGEPLLAGVTVQLLNSSNQVVATTVTDENGQYKFSNLQPGTFTVHEVQPTGYFEFGDSVGSAGGTLQGLDTIASVTLGSGVNGTEYDFCVQAPASISGMIHVDTNGDCIYEPGEPLLAGVTVQLIDSSNQIVATTVTDQNGQYKFSNLMPGTYSVHEVQPNGYFEFGNSVGSAGGALQGLDTITGATLGSGVNATDYDFCVQAPASISGMIHVDTNGDCIYEPGEPLLAGVTVQLLNSSNQVVATTVTDQNGQYNFSNLQPGTYTVHEVQPTGYFEFGDSVGSVGGTLQGLDTIASVTLGSGVNGTDYDFCVQAPASISGMVHVDLNGDCIYEPGEPLLAGVTIQLLNSSNDVVATTVTDQNGQYKFGNLQPGTYTVHEVQPAGYYEFGDSVGSAGGTLQGLDTIAGAALGSGVNATDYDFCVQTPPTISGMVHVDLNGDCIYEPGEPLLAGVTIQLIDSSNQVVATTVTDQNGQYKFTNLTPGTYTVHEVQPAGYYEFGDSVGSAGGMLQGLDTIVNVPLAAGVNATDYNFCVQTPPSISGMVHVDLNGDCIYEPGEPLLAGVTIQLIDSSNQVVASTVTDQNGQYKFSNLQPGTYTVHELPLSPYKEFGDSVGSVGGTLVGVDTITSIPIAAGVTATDYDFCVQAPSFIPLSTFNIPSLVPMANPPTPIIIIPTPLTDSTSVPLSLYYGGGYAGGYTWHLSIVDAGEPRGVQAPQTQVALISMKSDPFQMGGEEVHNSEWVLGQDGDEEAAQRLVRFGMRNGIPVTGDFNGDGITDVGFFYNGQWFIDLNSNSQWDEGDLWAKLGHEGDKPVTGDWDGDGKTDIGIFGRAWPGDPSAIRREPGLPAPLNTKTGPKKNVPPETEEAALGYRTLKHTSKGDYRADVIDHVFHYGTPGDIPVTGDWHGTGVHTIGLFYKGRWLLDSNGDGKWTENDSDFRYGVDGDQPIVGDFNGDGIDELGVYRAGTWYVDTNGDRVLDARDKLFELGAPGDVAVVGDWNGDGVDEPGVYHEGAQNVAAAVPAAPAPTVTE
ncbi:MAG TPA: SdrD B-like domain-containing protein [Pirellulales bacterium]